jgi:hypothetical protein
MKRMMRTGSLAVVLGLVLLVVVLMVLSLSTVAADGTVDLIVEIEAPSHTASGSTYQVRMAVYNLGNTSPPDARLSATLPAETQLISSTDRWGEPWPPDEVNGDVLSWDFENPDCYRPLNSNCGHVLLKLEVDEGLPDGTELTTVAAISTTGVETDTTNNETTSVTLVGAMAASGKQVHARLAQPGDVLSYTITLSPAQHFAGKRWISATVTDTLPFSHQVRFLGYQGETTGTMHDGHFLTWQAQVQAGQPLQLQYRLGIEGVVTPGTVLTNTAWLRWENQIMQLGPVTTVVTLPHGALALGPNQAGEVYHNYGVSLTVPPGAVSDTTRFQIGPLFTDRRPIEAPPGLIFANRAFEVNAYRFEHRVTYFNEPLSITFHFSPTDAPGLVRNTIRLYTRNGPEGPWAMLGQPVREMSGTLSFSTTHLSQFAMFGEGRFKTYVPVMLRR